MKPPNVKFILVAVISVVAYWLVMSLRYAWFLEHSPYIALQSITLSTIAAVVVVWIWLPSRILAGIISVIGLVLPPMVMPESFVAPNVGFAPFALCVTGLIVFATHIRLRAIGVKEHAL
jgi:hypothetical protein